MGELDPAVWDNFDTDNITRVAAEEWFNIPQRMLRDPEMVVARREKRQEDEAMNSALGQLGAGASAAKDLSDAIATGRGE